MYHVFTVRPKDKKLDGLRITQIHFLSQLLGSSAKVFCRNSQNRSVTSTFLISDAPEFIRELFFKKK